MKIEQNPKFQPITITLETKEEHDGTIERQHDINELTRTLSNWFSNEAQL